MDDFGRGGRGVVWGLWAGLVLGGCSSLLGDEPPAEGPPEDAGGGARTDGGGGDASAAARDAGVGDAAEPAGVVARSVVAGRAHSCVLSTDGRVYCWGENALGQLGNGDRMQSLRPTPVVGLAGVEELAAGADFTCARLGDGSLRCWGSNVAGQLGNAETDGAGVTEPVEVVGLRDVVTVAAGVAHACARTVSQLSCWGDNAAGQVGVDPTSTSLVSTPRALGVDAIAVSLGKAHTCALRPDKKVDCWGDGRSGQLGKDAVGIDWRPQTVTPAVDVTHLSAQYMGVCVHRVEQQAGPGVHCWGRGRDGELGLTPIERQVPTPVAATSSAVAMLQSGEGHTCVLEAGKVACFGKNSNAQLGVGHTDPLLDMHEVSLPEPIRDLAAGREHSCAATVGGRVLCWGANPAGTLGTGSGEALVTSPERVLGIAD